jgi:16S rRNA C967 or C1407 C5-methylase (RsmB/RsmF family)
MFTQLRLLRCRCGEQATAKALHGSADFQRNFLWTAVFLLKPGGTLVYSTCTISPLENECMVRYALDTYPCLRLVAASPKIGGEGVETAGLSDEERALVQSFDPANEELDTTGFFAAKFVKTASLFEGKEDAAEDGAGGQTAEA